jgi:hypothetical protein
MPSGEGQQQGKPNTQKTASGWRRNSRMRASVSSTSGCERFPPFGSGSAPVITSELNFWFASAIAQHPPRQIYEHVFERRLVRRQLIELEVLSFKLSQ